MYCQSGKPDIHLDFMWNTGTLWSWDLQNLLKKFATLYGNEVIFVCKQKPTTGFSPELKIPAQNIPFYLRSIKYNTPSTFMHSKRSLSMCSSSQIPGCIPFFPIRAVFSTHFTFLDLITLITCCGGHQTTTVGVEYNLGSRRILNYVSTLQIFVQKVDKNMCLLHIYAK